MTDDEVEAAVVAKGLTAPRITKDHVKSVIIDESYTTLPSGKTMICELTLRNGFTVRGEASVVSKANFDYEIGLKISRANAVDKIWQLEAYLLQENLWRQ